MKKLIFTSFLALTFFAFSCNNTSSNADTQTDSIGTEAVPGNSPVTPNANSAVVPSDNQTNSNGLDTGKVDSIAGVDSTKARH